MSKLLVGTSRVFEILNSLAVNSCTGLVHRTTTEPNESLNHGAFNRRKTTVELLYNQPKGLIEHCNRVQVQTNNA